MPRDQKKACLPSRLFAVTRSEADSPLCLSTVLYQAFGYSGISGVGPDMDFRSQRFGVTTLWLDSS
jgi:hypothetical protein